MTGNVKTEQEICGNCLNVKDMEEATWRGKIIN
jgi:hypothetical protein